MSFAYLVGTAAIAFVVIMANKSAQELVTGKSSKFQLEVAGRRLTENVSPAPGCTSAIMCAATCNSYYSCLGFQYRKTLPSESHGRCEILESEFDMDATSLDTDCDIFMKVSTETSTPTDTECKTLNASTVACHGGKDIEINSLFSNCSYNYSDTQTRLQVFDNYKNTWNGAKHLCFIQGLVQVDVKDMHSECMVQKVLMHVGKWYKPTKFKTLGFALGLHKNFNEKWKFSDGSIFTDFPEFFVGRDSVNEELCAYIKLAVGERVQYITAPCDVKSYTINSFYPMCTDP